MYINDLNSYLKNRFGQKVYKVSINAGMTCPNRDGTLGTGGCIFCSKGGSGDFAQSPLLSVTRQIEQGKLLIRGKFNEKKNSLPPKYIAYFQAYTNTYAPVCQLEKIFKEAVSHKDIVAISIGTRPDCIDEEKAALLASLNKIKPVFVELGLQTSNEKSAAYIRRGYTNDVFKKAVDLINRASQNSIHIVVHMIIGLPGETSDDMLETIHYINSVNVNGIKLQLLHVLSDTDLAVEFKENPFHILSLEEYTDILVRLLRELRPDIVIHRMTGDGPKKLLVAPLWSGNKKHVMNYIHNRLLNENVIQGELYGARTSYTI